MAEHFEQLLTAVTIDPSRSIDDIPLLTESERNSLVSWSATGREVTVRHSLDRLFEIQAARRPEAVAVECEDELISYRQLNERANRLALRLRELGVGPEVLVGVCLPRSTDLVVAVLAIVKSGGAYVPMDPEYPVERIAFVLRDARARVLITHQDLKDKLPGTDAVTLCLESERGRIDAYSPENAAVSVAPGNLAYVIYTSGSTGAPKGSLITHANVVRLFEATRRHFNFGDQDTWTLFHSIAFDFSVWELWGALLHGGRLIVVPYLVSRSPSEFWRMVHERRVTVLNQTPSAFRLLQHAAAAEPVEDLALRQVIFGGEALDLSSLSDWYSQPHAGGVTLVNMYGITETTVHVTYRALSSEVARQETGSLIGAGLDDLRLYVLDKHWQFAPIGVPGELYDRRRRSVTRLPEPAGPDGREVRSRPVLGNARAAPVPDGR